MRTSSDIKRSHKAELKQRGSDEKHEEALWLMFLMMVALTGSGEDYQHVTHNFFTTTN